MKGWGKPLLIVVLLAAALCARLWYPQGAKTMSRWLLGPEDNCVVQVFYALDDVMGRGPAAVAEVFQEARHGLS